MIQQNVSLQKVVSFLNELLEIDTLAVEHLIEHRVPCNEGMAEHPSVQVIGDGPLYRVGLLDLLNGLFSTDEKGPIAAVYDDDDCLERFILNPSGGLRGRRS